MNVRTAVRRAAVVTAVAACALTLFAGPANAERNTENCRLALDGFEWAHENYLWAVTNLGRTHREAYFWLRVMADMTEATDQLC
jgi:hypothetical protein